MNLGENIYHYRTQRNLSQGALADELNVSRQSVSKWENNSAVPELDKLIKMSRLFGITLDELVNGPSVQPQAADKPASPYLSTRIQIGSVLLLFGMVFFLLSIFWGDHLYFGEAFGELISISVVLLAMSLLATYNGHVLTFCAVIYLLYSIVCFGIFQVTSLTNYLFVTISGAVILIWFLTWGTHASGSDGYKGRPFEA